MKHNRQKSGEFSPTSSKPKQAVNRPFKSPAKTQIETNDSCGVNPLIHQCPMYRRKPLSTEEADIQLKKKGVIK